MAGIWAQRVQLADRLARLREGNLTRVEAYNLFLGEGDIHQLGPSYFTKLLFFFSPTPDFYIMDQWTGKSINLLTGIPVVRMTRRNDATPLPSNKAGNYQAYCEEVDIIAKRLGVKGEQAEEMLMSKGRPDPWPWRLHVRQYWESDAPMVRYRATELHERYPHIPVEDF